MSKRDIVERLRDTGIDVSYSDRLRAAKEIERLRKERAQTDDRLAKARLKIEELEAELSVLREALKPIKRP